MEKFTITQDHIKLLQRMCVSWWGCEFGAPSIDCKRPYGNSDVISDICKILGWDYDLNDPRSDSVIAHAMKIHREMETVLQIIVLRTAPLLAGDYELKRDYDCHSWEPI